MSQEFLDIYDDNMRHIGVKERNRAHLDGDWHKSFHCWLIAKRGGCSYVLFQLRGPDKAVYPNTLDITAAGHLTQGESIKDGVREVEEELGIEVDRSRLIQLGTRTDVAIIGEITNREFCEVYLLHDDRDLTGYALQPEEVAGLAEMDITAGMQLFSGEIPWAEARILLMEDEKPVQKSRRISVQDVIPRIDGYYMKICIMAERYFDGRKYLAI